MEVQEFTKEWFEKIRKDIERLLQDYGERTGFEIRTGNINYTPGLEFTMQLQFRKKATADSDPQLVNWEMYCSLYGLTPDMYGKTICIKGKNLKVAGLNRKARTRVVELIGLDDQKPYSMDAESLKLVLAGRGKANDEAEKREWDTGAFLYGLKGVPYGAEFRIGGETFKISGLKHKARDYKVMAKRVSDGKLYKFRPSDVIEAIKS